MNILFLLEAGSMDERLAEGTTALIAGMGTVFSILILISIVISLFKFIKSDNHSNSSKDLGKPKIVEKTIVEQPEEVGVDELELVAVITAAIAASLNTTTDQLVVKSFRRINTRRI